MGRFDGKVALITGAARGQGRSHALALAREGAEIIAIDVPGEIPGLRYDLGYSTASGQQLEELVKDVESLDRRIIAREGDVRSQSDLDSVVSEGLAEFGKVDLLVANAGVAHIGKFWELTEEEWSTLVNVDLSGVWRAAKAVTPHMIERRTGSMVLISSDSGLEGTAGMAHYSAAKHGVIGLMRTAALELGSFNIRCNAICPGVVESPMVHWQGLYDWASGGPDGTAETLYEGFKHWHLLDEGEIIDSSAISNSVLFLASEEAAKITGVALSVDAGHLVMPGFTP